MKEQLFAYDFGTLSREHLTGSAVSNPTELLWDREMERTLRLCGVEADFLERASDYEKLCALCEAMPSLEGHPDRSYFAYAIDQYFGIETPVLPQKCKEIWRQAAHALLENPLSIFDVARVSHDASPIRWLCDGIALPDDLPHDVIPVFCGDLISPKECGASDVEALRERVSKLLDSFSEAGCNSISLRVPATYLFSEPDPYRVGLCLKGSFFDGWENLWLGQRMRLCSQECQSRGWTLILDVLAGVEQILPLLHYTERSVGLSRTVWMSSDPQVRDGILEFSAKPHKNELLWALRMRDFPTASELCAAWESAAARYPAGRLLLHTGADLRRREWMRQTAMAQIPWERHDQSKENRLSGSDAGGAPAIKQPSLRR